MADMQAGIGPFLGVFLLILGSFAVGSIALWVAFAAILRPACAKPPDADAPAVTAGRASA